MIDKIISAFFFLFYTLLIVISFSVVMAALIIIISTFLFLFLILFFYCRFKIFFCKFHLVEDMGVYKDILSFISWNVFGSFGVVVSAQGVPLIANIFYGVIINGSLSISNQLNAFKTDERILEKAYS